MKIVVNCPCGAAVTVRAGAIGRHALCPQCSCMFEVKSPAGQPAGGGIPPTPGRGLGRVLFAIPLLLGTVALIGAGGWYAATHLRSSRDPASKAAPDTKAPNGQATGGQVKSPRTAEQELTRVSLESLLVEPGKYRNRRVQFEGAVLAATRKPDSPGFLVMLASHRGASSDDESVVCIGFLSCAAKSVSERRWMRVRGTFVGMDQDHPESALCIHCEMVVPKQLEAYRELMDGARKHSEENQWRQAAETFRKARELFAESKESDEWLDADEALSAACRHVEFDDLVKRGRESLETRRYNLAQRQLRKALDLFPLHEDTQRLFHKAVFEELVLRGQAEQTRDGLSAAESDFRQALATARSHLDRACEQRAEESLEGVSREHLKRGRTAREQGRLDQTVDAFRSALNILPESVELREELASVLVDSARQLLQTAKYAEALPLIREAHRELAPNDQEYAALFDDIDHAVNQGEVLRLPVAHGKTVFLGFTQSDEQLILVAESGQVELVDVSSGRPIVEFASLESNAIMAALADNADRLAVCDRNGLVRVWQLGTSGKPRMLFASKMEQPVTCLALASDGETLAVGTATRVLLHIPCRIRQRSCGR